MIETQQHEVLCPHCQRLNRGQLPEGLEADRYFGPRLEATVVFLKHQQHMSYERIVQTLRELFGFELSEGGIDSIISADATSGTGFLSALRLSTTKSSRDGMRKSSRN